MNDADVKTFGEAIRHRIALILLVVALFGFAGLIVFRQTPPTYQASSQVYVDVSGSNQQNVDPSNNLLNSYWVNQATGNRVLGQASKQLGGGETAQVLQKSVSAVNVRSTNVVQITAQAWYANQAAARANAVAQAMVAQNKADAASQTAQQQKILQDRLNSLNSQINGTQAAVAANSNDVVTQTRLSSLYQTYNDTQNQLTQLQINSANQVNALRVLQQAQVPARPSAPDPRLYVGGGLLVGAIVGLLLALLLERFDDRVLTTSQLGRAAGTSLIVGLPRAWRRDGSARNLHTLALAHLFARHPDATRILAVAVLPDQTATEAAEQLGVAAAGLGHRAQVMGTEAPATEEEAPDGELAAEAAGGYVGSSTTTVPLLPTRRIRAQAGPAEPTGQDVTIIATPSPMSSPAAVTAGRQADVAMLVVTAQRTRLEQVRQAAAALRATGLDVGGAILVPPPASWWRTLLSRGRGEAL
jgi:capsular polysaccharide biosynthesis protein